MKKLRFFDSLKFVVAAIVCTFILNVAHAATTAIQSVIAYGKTEQSGTPTPTNPVPIMTNNGVLKVSPNICTWNQSLTATGNGTQGNLYSGLFMPSGYEFEPGTQYTVSVDVVADNVTYSESGNLLYFVIEYTDGTTNYTGVTSYNYQDKRVVIKTAVGKTVSRIRYWNRHQRWTGGTITVSNMRIEEGSSATTGVYANGLTETIRDAAGHKATAQMLLSVGDYKDEQNITTGAITRRVGVKVLDGTEDWRKNVSLADTRNAFSTNLNFVPQSKVSYCTHLPNVTSTNLDGVYLGVGMNFILGSSSNITTAEQFKQWLAEQYANGTPVIVVYPLATETTESVAAQSLTTAPVRQTLGAIMDMPIKTILTDNTEIMSGANELIKIATTKYNEESFTDVQDALTGVFNAVDTVVSQTMTQAQAIDQIANEKQTRPDEGCTAKYCLLVEDEDGTPHWYPIAGANGVAHALPAGYTELQYIESTGTQYIDTGVVPTLTSGAHIRAKFLALKSRDNIIFGATDSTAFAGGSPFSIDVFKNQVLMPFGGDASNSPNYSPAISKTMETNVLYDFKLNYLNDKKASVNDTQVTYSNNPVTMTSRSLLLFNLNNSAGGMSQYAATQSQIFSAVITNGSNIEFNGVPAKRDSDGVIGVYDMVSGTFFTNAGTGTFTAGPDM